MSETAPPDKKVPWNPDDPLARIKGETKSANRAMRDYALMGVRRSLRSLRDRYTNEPQTERPPTRYYSTLAGWSFRYEWVKRVDRWDEIKAAEDEAQWDEYRRELIHAEQRMSRLLMEKAQEMIAFPLSEVELTTRKKEGEEGEEEEIVQVTLPVKWRMADVPRLADTASKLGRLASGLSTERKEIEFKDDAPLKVTFEES